MINIIRKKIKLLLSLSGNYFINHELFLIVEPADWIIKNIAFNISKYLLLDAKITSSSLFLKHSLVHYGAITTILKGNRLVLSDKNINIVTCFHLLDNDFRVELLKKADSYIRKWHTASTLTKRKLINLGIDEEKIKLIPLGISTSIFKPVLPEIKKLRRKELGISDSAIVIGSFQKDGNGWGEGKEPKLIKGPDIFCDVVEKLSKKYEIFIVLSGPARGYVKNRLSDLKIPFIHKYLPSLPEVAYFYSLCDLYIIPAREEGGPASVLESMASGVPLVSSKVGLAPDIIQDGVTGFLVDIGDVSDYVSKASKIIENLNLRNSMINEGLSVVSNYEWEKISNRYYNEIYKDYL